MQKQNHRCGLCSSWSSVINTLALCFLLHQHIFLGIYKLLTMLSEYKRLICLPEDTGCYTLLLGRQTKKTWLLFCYSLRLTLINNLLRYPGRGLGCWASLLLQDWGRSAHLHPRGQGSISWVWHRSPLWGRWCLDLGVQSMFGGV